MTRKNSNYPPLFQADKDWINNACLNFVSDPTYGYVEGYKRAADLLVSQVMETGRDQDYLVYPITFLYRHHLELRLKQIISDGRKLLGEGSSYPIHHELDKLWPTVKGLIRKIWSEEPDHPDFKAVEHFIAEMTAVDANSTAFRYPKTKDGNNTLQGLRHINLRHLAECIHSISELLDGVSCGIRAYLESKNEMIGFYTNFLQQSETERGNYTEKRDQWLGDPDLRTLAKEIQEKYPGNQT